VPVTKGLSINQWWDALSSPHQVFWFMAIIFSVLFFIQFLLLLIGFDSDSDTSFDHGGDLGSMEHEFSALSARSIIAFFTFFGWTGVLAMGNQLSVWISVALATGVGLTAMFIVAYLIYKFAQLEQSGTLNFYHALDQLGEVYLPIPPHQGGKGKIHLKIDGTVREMDAITEGELLKTGAHVKVIEIMEDNTLKVESLPVELDQEAGTYS
jgi:membrane protein implicated in regulation of membrane protease activity